MPTPIRDFMELIYDRLAAIDEMIPNLHAERAHLQSVLERLRNPYEDEVQPPQPLSASVSAVLGNLDRRRIDPDSPSDAALEVMMAERVAMHIRDIINGIYQRGWYTDREYESLRATIASTFDGWAKRGGPVRKASAATYELNEWYIQERLALAPPNGRLHLTASDAGE